MQKMIALAFVAMLAVSTGAMAGGKGDGGKTTAKPSSHPAPSGSGGNKTGGGVRSQCKNC